MEQKLPNDGERRVSHFFGGKPSYMCVSGCLTRDSQDEKRTTAVRRLLNSSQSYLKPDPKSTCTTWTLVRKITVLIVSIIQSFFFDFPFQSLLFT